MNDSFGDHRNLIINIDTPLNGSHCKPMITNKSKGQLTRKLSNVKSVNLVRLFEAVKSGRPQNSSIMMHLIGQTSHSNNQPMLRMTSTAL